MMGDFVSDNLMGFDSNKKASYKKWWYGVGEEQTLFVLFIGI